MYTYRTKFNLVNPVRDFEAAYEYLTEDDMSTYLKNDSRIDSYIQDSVESITWILVTEDSGYIELQTTNKLSSEQLKSISNWVAGQNSDGLGESFEQRDFASYEDEYNDYVMASFDWQTNDYLFELVSNS